MQRFVNSYQKNNIYHDPTGKSILLFDIETTGLSYERSLLYMISCGYYDHDVFTVTTLFNDDGISEENMLMAFIDIIQARTIASSKPLCLVSFNGLTFDVPFLQKHFEYNEIDYDLYRHEQLDLYKEFKSNQCIFGLEKCRQIDFEAYLGISRIQDKSGKELIASYRHFLKKKDEAILDELLRHNLYDVKNMEAMLPLLYLKHLDDQIGCILDINVMSDIFTVKMHLKNHTGFCISMRSDCCEHSYLNIKDDQLELCLPIKNGKIRIYYENCKDYYYLPSEDRAVHKSVGRYVDKEYRIRAKRETCYDRIDPERLAGLNENTMLPLLLTQMKCIFRL